MAFLQKEKQPELGAGLELLCRLWCHCPSQIGLSFLLNMISQNTNIRHVIMTDKTKTRPFIIMSNRSKHKSILQTTTMTKHSSKYKVTSISWPIITLGLLHSFLVDNNYYYFQEIPILFLQWHIYNWIEGLLAHQSQVLWVVQAQRYDPQLAHKRSVLSLSQVLEFCQPWAHQ